MVVARPETVIARADVSVLKVRRGGLVLLIAAEDLVAAAQTCKLAAEAANRLLELGIPETGGTCDIVEPSVPAYHRRSEQAEDGAERID
jgi:hypothetical protein